MADRFSEKDYSNYSFEDFLQDDFFISSVTNQDEGASDFWRKLCEEGELNQEEFNAARTFILKSLEENNKNVTDSELAALWQRIESTNLRNARKRKTITRRRIYVSIGVAASILVIFFSIPYFSKNITPNQQNNIVQYVEKSAINVDSISDIQLVLSQNKVIQVEEQESNIVYDSTEIKISSKETLKKEQEMVFNQLIVPKGKRSTLRLSDGTHLYVNAGTIVTYPSEFVGNRREIYVNGEIFIDVKPDASRPFIVRTSDVNIEVLGTKFNVMAYDTDENKQVALASGSVKILSDKKDKEITLKPSQMYQYNKGNFSVAKVDLIKYTAWVSGLYYFESERLDDVMRRLSRYYGKTITFDEKIASLRCSGKMDLKDNLLDVLNGLTFSFPIKVEYDSDKYHIRKNIK